MMIVDCMTCPVRDQRCEDCAVTALQAPRWAEHLASAELESSPEPPWSTALQLDAAENEVVSILVGAGLVNSVEAARLSARRDSISHWGTARSAG
jgi:hypothetical protein